MTDSSTGGSSNSLKDLLESLAYSSFMGLVQYTRGDGLAHFDLHYPFMAAEGALERLTRWRQEQEDEIGRSPPGGDISHDATLAAYTDAICTQSMVAIVVPLLESVLVEFTGGKLRGHHESGCLPIRRQSVRGSAPYGKNFWSIEQTYEAPSWRKRGKAAGFVQLCDALELPKSLTPHDGFVLDALFWYRNRALHQGLHWKEEDLEELETRIGGNWSGIFSGALMRGTIDKDQVVMRLKLPSFNPQFENDLLPWLRRFLTYLGDLDIALKRRHADSRRRPGG